MMMQIPNLPNYNFSQIPQPNYNAVKIDVHNPMVNVPAQMPAQAMPQYIESTMPAYAYPQAQLYQYPQSPLYTYPQAPVQPYYMPPVINTPEMSVPNTPMFVPPTVEQTPQVPVQTIPLQPVQQPVPAPAVVTETQETDAPKNEKTVELVPPVPVTPQVDLNAFLAKLTNPDYDVQAAAMEEIAGMINDNPDKATELLDTKIVDALTNIITSDTSKLDGPTEAQSAARQKLLTNQQISDEEKNLAMTITPYEQAERNKCFAMYTSAIMQKLYADEVQKLTNSTVPLTELPGAVTIVEQLKNNPNPMVRTSAVEALSYVQNPAYEKDLTTIFTVAQKDQDPGVQEAAAAALAKLNRSDEFKQAA